MRGTLLAVGRPDGRLNALTSAENTVCLSANQASSIQNFGTTAETLTIGHHPFKLPLSAEAIFLPTARKLFVCEALLLEKEEKRDPCEAPDSCAEKRLLSREGSGSEAMRRRMEPHTSNPLTPHPHPNPHPYPLPNPSPLPIPNPS